MDFEFNLDEVDIGASNTGLDDYTFDPVNQSGGAKDELPVEDKLPGEELLDAPEPAEDVANSSPEVPEKVQVELVGNDEPPEENHAEESPKNHAKRITPKKQVFKQPPVRTVNRLISML